MISLILEGFGEVHGFELHLLWLGYSSIGPIERFLFIRAVLSKSFKNLSSQFICERIHTGIYRLLMVWLCTDIRHDILVLRHCGFDGYP